jgi:thymidylate synthase (FAD)
MERTTPKVHLLSRPQFLWHEAYDYLDDIGGESWWHKRWGRDTPPAEALVEFAGRLCYRSWEPGLNANVTQVRDDAQAYLSNILSVGHGSVLEHANFTFIFQDVSRVFTHELVRHRAGVAISQESLRFVRLDNLKVWVPTVFQDKMAEDGDFEDIVVSLVESLEEFQGYAAEAFGLDDEGVPFHYKKEVTSAMRRVAPIGLATTLVWTANVRTLRHVIEMRTAPGAEEEIRVVFDSVAKHMQNEAPLLFADYTRNDDGSWTTPNGKV